MQKIIFYIFLLLCFTGYGCVVRKNYKSVKLKQKKIIRYKLNVTENPNPHYVFYTEDSSTKKRYLIARDAESTKLTLFNYKRRNSILEIPFVGDVNKANISGFYMHNIDSFFVQQHDKNKILLINQYGNILKQWKLPDNITGINRYSVWASYKDPILYKNGKLYTSVDQYGTYNKPEDFNYNSKLIFDLTKDSPVVITQLGLLPEIYRQKGTNFHGGLRFPSSVINNNGEIVISFPVDHYIHVYNGNSEKEKNLVKSQFLDSFQSYNVNKSVFQDYDQQYNNSVGSYHSLLYDKWRKLYYRVVLPYNDFYNSDGTVNLKEDRPFTIMILDKDFKVLNEVKFPGKQFVFGNILAVKEGLMISINNPKNPLYKNDYYSYQLFKVKLK